MRGQQVTIVAAGNMVATAVEVAKLLAADGITADVINLRTKAS